MPDIIQLLPDHIANQIAAGEVIQRPASLVKELLENSVDASANHIQLIIKDAGKSLVQVIDNGKGMSFTDTRMSLERHATSKIKNIEDLFYIKTMGFRGEALASIAAVAQLEVKTKQHNENVGTLLIAEDSKVIQHEVCQTIEGTSISVKNLFFNVPARRHFLKSNPVETKHINDEFLRVAMAYPNISFSMFHNGIAMYNLEAGNIRKRIVDIFGNNYDERLVPISEKTDIVNFTGFVSKPEFARKTRGEQFFFVNNRFIKSNYLNHAVHSAYGELLPKEYFPFYVIYIDVKPDIIDINVHPTKQEIKFTDEKLMYTYLSSSIKHALGKYSVMPSIDFDTSSEWQNMEGFNKNIQSSNFEIENKANVNKALQWNYNPEKSNKQEKETWKSIYSELKSNYKEDESLNYQLHQDNNFLDSNEKKPYQIHYKYIVNHIKSGVLLIEQQSAHERILFEKYIKQLESGKKQSQQTLFPSQIQLGALEALILKEILDDLKNLGFILEEFGGNSFIIQGLPTDVLGGKEIEIIHEFIEQCKHEKSLKDNRRNILAKTFAQKNTIKNGKKLDEDEMKLLIDELFACEMPYTSPSGRLTFITLELNDLEKQFEKKY
jgi:DNA mismatch repair protein MutL